MRTMKRGLGFLGIAIAMLFAASAYASEAGVVVRGKMVSFNPETNNIIVQVDVHGLAGPERKDIAFNLAEDAKWTICLSGGCVEQEGIGGFKFLEFYRPFEPYGISIMDSDVILHHLRYPSGEEVAALVVYIP